MSAVWLVQRSRATRQGWKPALRAPPPRALSWESTVVSRAFGDWNCLEVNQGTEKLGPRVNYRGNDPGLVSLGLAGPVSQHCSPLKSGRWEGEDGSFLPAPFPPLCLSLAFLLPLSDAAYREAGAACLDPCQRGRPANSEGCPGCLGLAANRATFPWMTPTGFHGPSGPRCGALVSLFRNYTQKGWPSMVLGVSRRERKRKKPGEKPPTCPSNSQGRGRQTGRQETVM